MNPTGEDPIIWRRDLEQRLNKSSETIRRWMKDKVLPPPDVPLSRQSIGWKLSTLRAAGINL